MYVYSLSVYMSVCVCMHTCLHIAAAAAVSGFHWAYCQLGVACGNKLKLVVNWLNQKMALSSNVVDVAMSRTLKPNTDGMCIVTHNCRSVKSSTDSAKKNYVETTTLICRKSIGYCQMMLVMQTLLPSVALPLIHNQTCLLADHMEVRLYFAIAHQVPV